MPTADRWEVQPHVAVPPEDHLWTLEHETHAVHGGRTSEHEDPEPTAADPGWSTGVHCVGTGRLIRRVDHLTSSGR
jgi:hypothetical protein